MNSGNQGNAPVSKLGFGFIIAAPFLLFNPEYSVIDFLPDFIGYLFILLALRKLKDTRNSFSTAFDCFLRLLIISSAKFLSVFVVFSGFFSQLDSQTMMLLFAFVFNFLELLFLWRAWRSLFAGIGFFAGDTPLGARAPKVGTLTCVFVTVKAVLAVLPEFAVLSSHDYDETAFDWYRFIWLFRVSSVMVGAVTGLVWLAVITVFLVRAVRTRGLFAEAACLYESEIVGRPSVGVRRSIKFSLAGAALFFALSADFFLDGVNVIPDFVCAAAAVPAFLLMRRFSPLWKAGVLIAIPYAVADAVSWSMTNAFHRDYSDSMILRNTEAYAAFSKFFPLKIIENLFFAALAALMLLIFSRIVALHCGYVPENADRRYAEGRLAAIRGGLNARLAACAAVTGVYSLASAFGDLIVAQSYHIRPTDAASDAARIFLGIIQAVTGEWWAVCLLLCAVSFFLLLSAGSGIVSESDSKYMLD